MRPLTVDKLNMVISRHYSGQTTCQILSSTGVSFGTISKIHSEHCSDLPNSSDPVKLSLANIHYAINLITSGKAEIAVQVSKALQPMANQWRDDEPILASIRFSSTFQLWPQLIYQTFDFISCYPQPPSSIFIKHAIQPTDATIQLHYYLAAIEIMMVAWCRWLSHPFQKLIEW